MMMVRDSAFACSTLSVALGIVKSLLKSVYHLILQNCKFIEKN